MKSGFIVTSVLIPVFNILVFTITALMDVNIIFAVIPCIIGSILFAAAGYKLTIEPFVDQYYLLEDSYKSLKKNEELYTPPISTTNAL